MARVRAEQYPPPSLGFALRDAPERPFETCRGPTRNATLPFPCEAHSDASRVATPKARRRRRLATGRLLGFARGTGAPRHHGRLGPGDVLPTPPPPDRCRSGTPSRGRAGAATRPRAAFGLVPGRGPVVRALADRRRRRPVLRRTAWPQNGPRRITCRRHERRWNTAPIEEPLGAPVRRTDHGASAPV